MTSYHEHNRFEKAEELVTRMLNGENVVIITDAGTPCISDPGEILVQKCLDAGIRGTSLPGPSAVITALTLCGFSVKRFVFEGFLPRGAKKERAAALERLRHETGTIVLYEAPHHVRETLVELAGVLGNSRRISLCREMTKLHEEVIRTTLGEAVKLEARGEYVLVIEGRDPEECRQEAAARFEEMSLEEHLRLYTERGMDRREAMKAVAKDRGVSRREVYNALLVTER